MRLINYFFIFIARYIRFFLTSYPFVYFNIINFLDRGKQRLVTHKTDIVIEGFPRSGNTFLEALITLTSVRTLNIAHHTHSLAQLKKSVSLNKPLIILIRNPIDSISSLYNFYEGRIPTKILFLEYYKYYKYIYKNISKILLINFNSINNQSKIKEAITKRHSNFIFESIYINEKIIFNKISYVGRKRHHKNYIEKYLTKNGQLKKNTNLEVKNKILESSINNKELQNCISIYESLIPNAL